jgi:cellulose synthase/poly-beta-1,6-N-acetylglucosamine synthase-like glycosyltransferase
MKEKSKTSKFQQSKRMRRFSTLAGAFATMPRGSKAVRFKPLLKNDRLTNRIWAHFTVFAAFAMVLVFAGVLFWPSHWVVTQQPDSPLNVQNGLMLGILIVLQILLVIGTFSSARATLKARDPVPVLPPKKLRVAFITTRAPGEPREIVQTTLEAMKRVVYKSGTVDVWLLDETNDAVLRYICRKLDVKYFSRKGEARWNTPKPDTSLRTKLHNLLHPRTARKEQPDPFYAAKTKHGNINAWGQCISAHGYKYDILAGVDTDQVPEPNFLMRLLGYFRDPDVAFVVGPQVYGNYKPGIKHLVTRWAESQASFFQSTIQRAGNASQSAMFVGTNYAVRTNTLAQIKGFQPCITEDMATGIAIHASRNPLTGNHWKSVYTPDVLAIGEGPDTWGPYFTQQWRWAAGAFDTWRRMFWKIVFKTHPRTVLHYFLIMTFYPISALTWLLAILSSMIYLTSGATAVIAPWGEFVSLYLMSSVMQLSLYFWNRRYNVSPHEPEGSWGMAGMAISTLAAPIYYSALVGIVSGKKPNFVVTKKGGSVNVDKISAFKSHLLWAMVLIAGISYGARNGNTHPAMLIWAFSLLAVCLAPVAISLIVRIQVRLKNRVKSKPLTMKGATHA